MGRRRLWVCAGMRTDGQGFAVLASHQQFQAVAHALCAVGNIANPFDDLVQEHHVYRRQTLLQQIQLELREIINDAKS